MPILEILSEKRFSVSSHLIKVAISLNLSLNEFLLLMYFEDATDKTFDVGKITTILSLDEKSILSAFNKLLNLNLIKMETSKDNSNRHCEIISLVPMYKSLVEQKNDEEKEKNKENIFEVLEKELGRSISPMEYEIINAWLEKGTSEEMILGAVKEAVYNGVSSLRYIDKIIYEWSKKGYKNMVDVKKGLESRTKKKDQILFDYNWLDEE